MSGLVDEVAARPVDGPVPVSYGHAARAGQAFV